MPLRSSLALATSIFNWVSFAASAWNFLSSSVPLLIFPAGSKALRRSWANPTATAIAPNAAAIARNGATATIAAPAFAINTPVLAMVAAVKRLRAIVAIPVAAAPAVVAIVLAICPAVTVVLANAMARSAITAV